MAEYLFAGLVTLLVLAFQPALIGNQRVSATTAWYVSPAGNDSNDCRDGMTACATINGVFAKPGLASGDTIRVAAGTYTGTGDQVLLIDKDVTFSGGWSSDPAHNFTSFVGQSILDGQGARRALTIVNGAIVSMDRFTFQNGSDPVSSSTDESGGGGIENLGGDLTLTHSFVLNNSTRFGTGSGRGGGIHSSGNLSITLSTIANNSAEGSGGGIYIRSGMAKIIDSTIDGNQVGKVEQTGAGGGGIYNAGSLTLDRSTLKSNKSLPGYDASGIFSGGTLVLTNSTLSGNIGGRTLMNQSGGTAMIHSSTLTGSDAAVVYNAHANLKLQNTIVAGAGLYCVDPITSLGYNLIEASSGCAFTPASGDQVNVNARLAPLQDNGGFTVTHALDADSPARDRGDPAGCAGESDAALETDQRSAVRPMDSDGDSVVRCDIGAFESTSTTFQTYASDAFDRTVTDDWGTAPVGGHYSGTEIYYGEFDVNGSAATIRTVSNSVRTAYLMDVSALNLDATARVQTNKPAEGGGYIAYLIARASNGNQYLGGMRFGTDGKIYLRVWREESGTQTPLGTEKWSGLTYTANSFVWMRWQVVDTNPTTLRLRAWADGSPEPGTWTYTTTDSTASLQVAGAVGLRSYLSSSATNSPVLFAFDDLLVTQARSNGIGATPTPSLSPSPTSTPTATATLTSVPTYTSTPTLTPNLPTPTLGPTPETVTINVNTTDDELALDGNCSLREAIQAANTNTQVDACPAGGGTDTINVPAGTYILGVPGTNGAHGELVVRSNLNIVGTDSSTTNLDGNHGDRILRIVQGVQANITGLTLEHADAKGSDGGGINNLGVLHLYNVNLSDNSAPRWGGGLYNEGTAILNHVTISGGQANEGGGIFNAIGWSLTIKDSIIRDNTSTSAGAGIMTAGPTSLTNVMVLANTHGGGIVNYGQLDVTGGTFDGNQGLGAVLHEQGSATFTNVTFSNNIASHGGAISNYATLTIRNSLLHDNHAYDSGGAIDQQGTATLTNVTITDNDAGRYGGGINSDFCERCPTSLLNVTLKGNSNANLYGNYGGFTLKNTILDYGPYGVNCATTVTSLGGNLSSDNSCSAYFTAKGDRNNTNPRLGPLQDNGGPTLTHALLPGSPAIDKGLNPGCPKKDQRGVARPQDGSGDGIIRCDRGAFEVQPTQPPGMPQLISPHDGLTIGYSPVVLDWSAAAWASYYQVELYQARTTVSPLLSKKMIRSKLKTPSLAPGKWYYWRVRACNDLGCTEWTPFWKFAVTQ